jgi:Ca2+-binding EF-hand superfamily protein
LRCAGDLGEDVGRDEVQKMIEMGDSHNNGGVDLEDFIVLMKNLGLIPKEKKKTP